MGHDGSRRGRAFFSPSNHSPGCSGVCFSNACRRPSSLLGFYTNLTHLADRDAFAAHVQAMRRIDWVVYAKKPFGGPAQVLAYLGRYTHRVAIANSRIKALDDDHVAFTWKDYRQNGAEKIMRLKPDEFSEQSNMSRLMRQSPAPPSCAKLASLTGSSRLPNSPPWQ